MPKRKTTTRKTSKPKATTKRTPVRRAKPKTTPKRPTKRTRFTLNELVNYSDDSDDYEYEDEYFQEIDGKLVPLNRPYGGSRRRNHHRNQKRKQPSGDALSSLAKIAQYGVPLVYGYSKLKGGDIAGTWEAMKSMEGDKIL